MNNTDIVPHNGAIVMPAVTGKEALQAWKEYQDLKAKIVDKATDIQIIQGKEFLKKSYWRKVARFFNLSVDSVSESHEIIGSTIVWHFTCKAIAPNGAYAIGTGSCDAFEKATKTENGYQMWDRFKKAWIKAQPNTLHNIRSTAETRAFNRAVSNLVGGGEVSAEEVSKDTLIEVETEE